MNDRIRPKALFTAAVIVIPLAVGVQVWLAPSSHLPTLAVFMVALGLWAAAIVGVARGLVSLPVLVGAGGIGALAMVLLAPGTSLDFNSYAIYGRMSAEYGLSPYEAVPRDVAFDSWYPNLSFFWVDAPSVYGPVFAAISHLIMSAAGESVLLARAGFGLITVLCLFGACAAVATRIGWHWALVLITANPLVLSFGVNDLHCDVWVGAALVAGAVTIARGWVVVGALLLSVACLIKIAALPALAGAFVWLLFSRSKRDAAVLGATAALGMSAAVWLTGGLNVLQPILEATGRHTRFSVWNPLHDLLGSAAATVPGAGMTDVVVSLLANVAVASVGLYFIWRHRQDHTPFVAIAVGLVAYQLLGAYVLSWYALWSLPVLALAANTRWFWIAMGHGAWLAGAYLSGWFALATIPVALLAWRLSRGSETSQRIRQTIVDSLDRQSSELSARSHSRPPQKLGS